MPFRLSPGGRGWLNPKMVPSEEVAPKPVRRDFSGRDRGILQHPGEAHITAPRPQSRHSQPLDFLHRTGSIASDAERQPEIETAVSRDQDQDIAGDPAKSWNIPAILAPVVDDDALDDPVSRRAGG